MDKSTATLRISLPKSCMECKLRTPYDRYDWKCCIGGFRVGNKNDVSYANSRHAKCPLIIEDNTTGKAN